MTPDRAQQILDELIHAWLLDIEAVPYPIITVPDPK